MEINKYNNAKIYIIKCKVDESLIYIGSSINYISRWKSHLINCKNENSKEFNKLLYVKMRELGIDNFYIEVYENYSCNNINELRKKEGEIIKLLGTLNKCIAGRNGKEWETDNKDRCKEMRLKYRLLNREKINAYYKKYREKKNEYYINYRNINKDKINDKSKERYYKNIEYEKERSKKYKKNNKLIISEKNKQNRENNKDEINKKAREKYIINIEKEKERKKKFRENNKDEINKKAREKYIINIEKEKERKRIAYLKKKELLLNKK